MAIQTAIGRWDEAASFAVIAEIKAAVAPDIEAARSGDGTRMAVADGSRIVGSLDGAAVDAMPTSSQH